MTAGPLAGVTIVEMKGLGPLPYAGMLLADMGAEVIVLERASQPTGLSLPSAQDVHSRGKRSIAIDVKHPDGLAVLFRLLGRADVFLEGFRPGVTERLGFGPEECLGRYPRLVYGRLTGWGQTGPLARAAGHDINYIALTGALAAIGGKDRPVPPLNLVGDFAGGSLFLVVGVLAALLEAQRSGQGQIVDAAITDGTASLMSMIHGLAQAGLWSPRRGANLLDGAAAHYGVYETADAEWIAIGPLEPRFRRTLVELAGLDADFSAEQGDPQGWAENRAALARVFKARTRAEWCALLEGTDACFAPVLDYEEAPEHAHNKARSTYVDVEGRVQPAPAPRFSRSASRVPGSSPAEGADADAILRAHGYAAAEIAELRSKGALP